MAERPGHFVGQVRAAVHEVNASIAVGEVSALDDLLDSNLAGARFRTWLMIAFGGTALLLALLGIAGVMTGSVSKRRRELGVRLALGANPRELRGMVLAEGVRLVVVGVALGLVGALSLAGVLDSLLFGVPSRDPLVFTLVTIVLSGAATATCWLPALRASRVDPVVSLQAE